MGQPYVKENAINIVHILIVLSICPINLKHPQCRSILIMRPPARDTFWEIISKYYGFREQNSKLMA